jgi:myo-inositol 2-dehydrogenase / D-chiro-inositol 1-dehydrogenase
MFAQFLNLNKAAMKKPLCTSRRDFLKHSSAALAGAALATVATPRAGYCAETNTIKVALVGCGGRGAGAALNALSTSGPSKLWAAADVFPHRIEGSLNALGARLESQVVVPPERRFLGFDAFKQAIDSLDRGDLVILATPPAFRPIHFEYAVERGMHVFMEKSFAVDAPGIRRVLRVGEAAARKNLKIATGLMSRHSLPLEQAIERIHDGALGELITCWAYRMHGPVGFTPRKPGASELAHQITNYSCFTWLNGSFLVDWLIHNIDVCCWAKNAWPNSAQGMGGRQVRQAPDQLFDHYACEFTFPDGARMHAQGRHMAGCHDFFGNVLHGARGCAVLGEGQPKPRLFSGYEPSSAHILWDYNGAPCDPYQREMDLLFQAIRNDQPWNEVERSAQACMTAILGRMAVESGRRITYDHALASDAELAPGLAQITSLDHPAPVMPDADGNYPIAMPGLTQVL